MRRAVGIFLLCAACGSFGSADETPGLPARDAGPDVESDGPATVPADAGRADALVTVDAEVLGCGGAAACERVVFMTFAEFYADELGFANADTKCNTAAKVAKSTRVVGRKFKAWLSDGSTDAKSRLTQGTAAYVRPDGTPIAADWNAFASVLHGGQMNVDEHGVEHFTTLHIWTGTNADGTRSGQHCNNWSSRQSSITGTRGQSDQVSGSWSNHETAQCTSNHRIYCVEE